MSQHGDVKVGLMKNILNRKFFAKTSGTLQEKMSLIYTLKKTRLNITLLENARFIKVIELKLTHVVFHFSFKVCC